MTTTWDPDKGPSDDQVNEALRVLRAEYWTSIRSTAKDLVRRIKEGELTSEDKVTDAIHEDADGSSWVIYTAQNYRAIMCSDHDPWEDVEEQGSELKDNQTAVLAYFCVRHDITEQLEAELGSSPYDYFEKQEEAAAAQEEAADE